MKTSHEFEDLDDSANLEIIASIVERVTFASHQNDIAVIADLVVKNNFVGWETPFVMEATPVSRLSSPFGRSDRRPSWRFQPRLKTWSRERCGFESGDAFG
jgi:hypothetical protein